MASNPPSWKRSEVVCTKTDCWWPGDEDCTTVIARQLAKTHLEHTGHTVQVIIHEWFEKKESYE